MAEFSLHDHPSQKVHDITGELVPNFPNQRSVRLGGKMIAIVSEHGILGFTYTEKVLGTDVMEAARKFVEREFMPVTNMMAPAERTAPEPYFEGDE